RMLQATVGTLLVLFSVALTILIPYKKGRDRRSCMLQCRNMQQAMRSYHSVNGHNAGEVFPTFGASTLVGPGLFIESMPVCGAGGKFTWVEGRIPLVGELMILC